MDEATASEDNEAEKTFQKIIEKYFKDSSIITIAHRINRKQKFDRYRK